MFRHLREFIVVSGIALLLSFVSNRVAWGATYYCFTGSFTDGSDVQNFYFTLDDALTADEPMSFKTWHYNGGTNWAGATIAGGNFDPTLGLYTGAGSLVAFNDDSASPPPYPNDSHIPRSSLPATLGINDYNLQIRAWNNTLGGRGPDWAVDIEGPDSGMHLTGVSAIAGSTLKSFYLGSDVRTSPARLSLVSGQSINFTEDLGVGFSGYGVIDLMDATMQCRNMYIGTDSDGCGDVNVDGKNAHLTVNNDIYVGYAVNTDINNWNYLLVTRGASLDSPSTSEKIIANASGSIGYVYVDDLSSDNTARATWTSSGPITVGRQGKGSMDIRYGGLVQSPGGSIAKQAGSAGSIVEVYATAGPENTPAQWDLTGNLYIGGGARGAGDTGTLFVGAGGYVNISSPFTLKIWNTGTVNLNGGQISTGSLVNNHGSFTHTNGELDINGGTFDPGTTDYYINGAIAADYPSVYLFNGATFSLPGRLDVGRDNRGVMYIGSNSHVTSSLASLGSYSGGQGWATVNGSNAIWTVSGTQPDGKVMWIGGDNYGQLYIGDGGLVTLTGDYSRAVVGNSATGFGEVYVSGPGSRFESHQDILVGYSGHGGLNIYYGGAVVANPVDSGFYPTAVGDQPNSLGEVIIDGVASDGTRSQWIRYGNIIVGGQGRGTVSITHGGLMSSMGGIIGAYAGSAGSSVTLEGVGGTAPAYLSAEWSASSEICVGGNYVGPGDSGRLTVKQGGYVHIPAGSFAASTLQIWAPGTVELLGGQITTGSLINSGGTFTHTDGILEVNGGTFNPGVVNYVLDGAVADDMPTVKLLNGAMTGITGDITMGNVHRGGMEISGGSQAICFNAYIGREATSNLGSSVYLTGDNSRLTVNGDYLIVGWNGVGGMSISNGAAVSCHNAFVGVEPASAGSGVSIVGAGTAVPQATWTVAGQLSVGNPAGSGNPESVSVYIGPDGLLRVVTEISVHASGLLHIEDGTIQADHIALYGGKLSGSGHINDPLYSQNGTVDVPVQGSLLFLHNNLVLFGNSFLQKTGAGNLLLEGAQTWYGNSALIAADGVVQYSCLQPSTVENFAALVISDGGLVQVHATFDPFTDSLNPQKHVTVLNQGSFEIYDGSPIAVVSIEGTGDTVVHSNAHLESGSIIQDSLTIGPNATVTIRPIAGGPLAGDVLNPVPEPSTWILLALAGVTFFTYRKCRRPYKR
jgi:T5SS/PEP-CTERM-associated repeat protein